MEFSASLDKLSKFFTFLTFSVVIYAIYKLTYAIVNQSNTRIIYYWSAIVLFLFLIVVFSYLFSPQKYIINKTDIVIKRPIKDITLHLANILSIKKLDRKETRGLIRYFGVGGLFGWYGKFWNKKNGKMTF